MVRMVSKACMTAMTTPSPFARRDRATGRLVRPSTAAREDRARRWDADPMSPRAIFERLGGEEEGAAPASLMPEHQGDGA